MKCQLIKQKEVIPCPFRPASRSQYQISYVHGHSDVFQGGLLSYGGLICEEALADTKYTVKRGVK
jgi:hypothetical protein